MYLFRSTEWKSFTVAFIRLIHCFNCINEIPDCQVFYTELLRLPSVAQTSKGSLENLTSYIAKIEIDGMDSDIVKECLSGILECMGSIVNDALEKGKTCL